MGEFRFSELMRLFIPLGFIIFLFFMIVFVIIPPYFKNYLINSENDKIKQLVQSEIQLLDSLEKDVVSGELTAEEARNMAVYLIRDQRHGKGKEFYFWIIDMEPVLIMHPFRPELENTNVGNYKDPKGNLLFSEMVELVKEKGGGYLEYQWQLLDNANVVIDKKSYVEGYTPWGWIIGTGFYKEVTLHEINNLFRIITLVSVTVMVIIVLVSVILIKQRFEIRKKNKFFAKSLVESEKRYKVLIDSMNEGFMIQDQNEVLFLVNAQLCLMMGYNEQELLGRSFIDFIADKDRELYSSNIKSKINQEDAPLEISLSRADGGIIHVIISPRGMFSEEGDFQGSFSTITNVSSLKRIEEELSKSIDEKDLLIKEIHHRVKNNLQIITSLLSMQKDEVKKPFFTEMITVSEARIYSMALVHEILYESENFKYINLDEYINRLAENQMITFRGNLLGIKLHVDIDEIPVSIDKAVYCGLVINELVTNAINHAFKHTEGDKNITINGKIVDKELIILISDNGSGMPEDLDMSEHIGLKLVYLLIEQMGARVELSVPEGNGSMYSIYLSATTLIQ